MNWPIGGLLISWGFTDEAGGRASRREAGPPAPRAPTTHGRATDMSGTPSTPLDERLLEATTGALELFGIYLGDRLGLYDALHEAGPLTSAQLADAADIAPRYARE